MKNNILESWKKYRQKYREFDPYKSNNILKGKKYGRLGTFPIEDRKKNVKKDAQLAVMALSGNYDGPLPSMVTKGKRRQVRLLQSIFKKFGGIANLTPEQRNSQVNRDAVTHTAKMMRRDANLNTGSDDPRINQAMRVLAFARDNMPGSRARQDRRKAQYHHSLGAMALRYYDKLTFGKGDLSHNAPFERRLDVFEPHSQN